MKSYLGKVYRDRITGFTGVATAVSEYLTGYKTVELTPTAKSASELHRSEWIEASRLEPTDAPGVSL
jgi:hypothetical protein